MKFQEHKEITAQDVEAVIAQLQTQVASIREGNMDAFVQYWMEGGTEEGDAKILMVREMLLLRYFHRQEAVQKDQG